MFQYSNLLLFHHFFPYISWYKYIYRDQCPPVSSVQKCQWSQPRPGRNRGHRSMSGDVVFFYTILVVAGWSPKIHYGILNLTRGESVVCSNRNCPSTIATWGWLAVLHSAGCNTCQCNECNGTCNTMMTNFPNLLWIVVVWFRFNLIQVIGGIHKIL